MRAYVIATASTLVAFFPCLSSAQSVYAGAGLGPTVVLDVPAGSRSTYTNVYGVLGWQSRRSLGIRLEGAETYSRLWLSLELAYRFGPSVSALMQLPALHFKGTWVGADPGRVALADARSVRQHHIGPRSMAVYRKPSLTACPGGDATPP